MPTLLYTEKDADRDINLFLNERFSINRHTILGKAQNNSGNKTDKENEVLMTIEEHFRSIRFLNFANDYISSEISYLESDNWEMVDFEQYVQKQQVNLSNSLTSKSDNDHNKNSKWPMKMSVNTLIDNSSMQDILSSVDISSEQLEARVKQLRKDIERDRLLVNGIYLVGANSLLEGVLTKLKEVMDIVLEDAKIMKMPTVTRDHLALAVLYKASRTNSGGIAFTALQNLINPDTMLLIPQSSITPPMKITMSMNRFPCMGLQEDYCSVGLPPWGLVCQITCEYFYLIRKQDDIIGEEEDKEHKVSDEKGDEEEGVDDLVGKLVSVTFEDYVLFEIKLYGNEMANIRRVIDDSPTTGHVIIKPVTVECNNNRK